jgi:hypothetical protein
VIELLGVVIFATVIGIGLLDVRSGLNPLAKYRSATVIGVHERASAPGDRGDDNEPRPPAPAR